MRLTISPNNMKVIKGDLISLAKQGQFNVIIHGCNCFCTMGAGIAAQIKKVFPKAYEADLTTRKGDKDKLGGYSIGREIVGNSFFHDELVIVNAYTQFNWARQNDAPVDYDAISSVLSKVDKSFPHPKTRFGLPRIGCGLAGGDWEKVEDIILDKLGHRDTTVVVYG